MTDKSDNLNRDKIYSGLELMVDIKEREQALKHDADIHRIRTIFLEKLFKLILWYLITIALLIISQIILKAVNKALDDSILITILTTTTANVLGIFYIVVSWLFPNKHISAHSLNFKSPRQ